MILILILLITFIPNFSFAQDYNGNLEPILISANRSAFSKNHTAQSATIISYQEIQNLPASNLAEVLNYVTGVTINNNGSFGQSTSVSMRGADSRQVLVMVDGVIFNNQLSGQANLSIIPLDNVDRIEIIRGGDSSAWGSALGGVINVITKTPDLKNTKSKVKLTSSFGQFAMTKNSLQIQGNKEKFGFNSFGSFLHSDGNLAQSRTQETKQITKLTYNFTESSKINALFGYSGSKLQYGPTKDANIIDQPYQSRYGQLNFNQDIEDGHWNLAYKYNDQDITTDFYNSNDMSGTFSVISKDVYQGASIVGQHYLGTDHVVSAGSDFDWHTIKSSVYLPQSKSINMQAPFINDVWTIGDFDIQPGLRYDHNSQFGAQLSPSLGGVFHFPNWDEASFKLRASRVFNAPPLLWIYNQNTSFLIIPNPDLKAERAYSYDAGIEFKPLKKVKVLLEGYFSDVKDGIATVQVGSDYQSRNFKKFRRQGGQAKLDYNVNKNWAGYSSVEFNDVMNIQTKKLVRDSNIAREAFKWGLNYLSDHGLNFNWSGYYFRSMADPSSANDRKPIFDIKISQEFKQVIKELDLELFLSLHNITNSKYWVSETYPYPGRYLEGGFSLIF